ncbi:TIR domain-containing protein [Aeromonas veronii]
MSKKIFISHAVKDKKIVDAFVDLLQTGANIPYDEIFCSSLEGLGIPAGANFVDHIKEEIQSPELVIAIITQNYLMSQFCMCELGAAWAMSHNMYPVLVPPLEYADVQGVLKSTQLVRINDEKGLSQFANNVNDIFPEIKVNIPRWNAKQKTFLKAIPKLLNSVEIPEVVSYNTHQATLNELQEANTALEELAEENSELQEKVKKLKSCKDAKEVIDVEKEFSTNEEELDQYLKNVSSILDQFDRAIAFVAYREYGSGEAAYIDYYKDPDTLDLANSAVDNEYLMHGDDGYSLNHQHPKIKKLCKAIEKLSFYIQSEAPSELFELYETEHEIPLSISNREFWQFAISPAISRVYA